MAEHRLSDALVANLAVWASDAKPTTLEVEALACEVQESRAEIERLRAALALAIGELSTYGPMRYTSPDQLMEHFMEEARRG